MPPILLSLLPRRNAGAWTLGWPCQGMDPRQARSAISFSSSTSPDERINLDWLVALGRWGLPPAVLISPHAFGCHAFLLYFSIELASRSVPRVPRTALDFFSRARPGPSCEVRLGYLAHSDTRSPRSPLSTPFPGMGNLHGLISDFGLRCRGAAQLFKIHKDQSGVRATAPRPTKAVLTISDYC